MLGRSSWRRYSTQSSSDLKTVMRQLVPEKREHFAKFKKEHSDTVIGEVKVQNLIGGMRGLKAMLWEVIVDLAIPQCANSEGLCTRR